MAEDRSLRMKVAAGKVKELNLATTLSFSFWVLQFMNPQIMYYIWDKH